MKLKSQRLQYQPASTRGRGELGEATANVVRNGIRDSLDQAGEPKRHKPETTEERPERVEVDLLDERLDAVLLPATARRRSTEQ